MEREMWQVKVSTDDERSLVRISQETYGDDDSTILIHPDQVEMIIQWLRDAKNELQGH